MDDAASFYERHAAAVRHLGWSGRLLDGSKSSYLKGHPDNVVFFNANVYDATGKKIWFGDVDLTSDEAMLRKLVAEIGPIYVAREMPYRFQDVTVQELHQAATREAPSVYFIA